MSDVNGNHNGFKKADSFSNNGFNAGKSSNIKQMNIPKTVNGEINPLADPSAKTSSVPVKEVSTTLDNFKTKAVKTDDVPEGYVALFGGRMKMNKIVWSLLRIFLPLMIVVICAFSVSVKIKDTLNDTSNIAGKFDVVSVESNEYIKLNSDGTYSMSGGNKGIWNLSDDVFTFDDTGGNIIEGRYVDKKYIALIDENYYFGQIPESEDADVTLTSGNGNTILLDRYGNVTLTSGYSEPQTGTYIIDSSFIIVTLGDVNTTFIKCRDGITSIYYQI